MAREVTAPEETFAGLRRFNAIMGLVLKGAFIGLLPLALVHVLRGSSEARAERRAEIQKMMNAR